MFAGLLWKPWLRGHLVTRRRRINRRAGLIHRIVVGGFGLLYAQSKLGLYSDSATPLLNVLLKWSRFLWFSAKRNYARLVALICLCVIQEMLGFGSELAKFFGAYLCKTTISRVFLGTPLLSQRKKRFFFVNQQPKRFVLWVWSLSLLQSSHTAPTLSRPLRVLRVLTPASFLLSRKKLKRFKKKR